MLGQQIHGYVDPGQWSYFSLTLRRNDPSWQGGVAVAFLTTGGGYPVVLQKYNGVPSLLNNDRVLRCCIVLQVDTRHAYAHFQVLCRQSLCLSEFSKQQYQSICSCCQWHLVLL